ncbi:hypothetical protein LZ30DRAFT_104449 [Colletotrichum cereale]|nr:hypothetical protein LZ30DRAFT_104449 [Colletotrichum cereale]
MLRCVYTAVSPLLSLTCASTLWVTNGSHHHPPPSRKIRLSPRSQLSRGFPASHGPRRARVWCILNKSRRGASDGHAWVESGVGRRESGREKERSRCCCCDSTIASNTRLAKAEVAIGTRGFARFVDGRQKPAGDSDKSSGPKVGICSPTPVKRMVGIWGFESMGWICTSPVGSGSGENRPLVYCLFEGEYRCFFMFF